MKKVVLVIAIFTFATVLTSCAGPSSSSGRGRYSNTEQMTLSGAAIGAAIGAAATRSGKGAALGAAIGAGTGMIFGITEDIIETGQRRDRKLQESLPTTKWHKERTIKKVNGRIVEDVTEEKRTSDWTTHTY